MHEISELTKMWIIMEIAPLLYWVDLFVAGHQNRVHVCQMSYNIVASMLKIRGMYFATYTFNISRFEPCKKFAKFSEASYIQNPV